MGAHRASAASQPQRQRGRARAGVKSGGRKGTSRCTGRGAPRVHHTVTIAGNVEPHRGRGNLEETHLLFVASVPRLEEPVNNRRGRGQVEQEEGWAADARKRQPTTGQVLAVHEVRLRARVGAVAGGRQGRRGTVYRALGSLQCSVGAAGRQRDGAPTFSTEGSIAGGRALRQHNIWGLCGRPAQAMTGAALADLTSGRL
jgi:hypothetical protein